MTIMHCLNIMQRSVEERLEVIFPPPGSHRLENLVEIQVGKKRWLFPLIDVDAVFGPVKEYAVESHRKSSPRGAAIQVVKKSFYLTQTVYEVEAIRPQWAGYGELHRGEASPRIPTTWRIAQAGMFVKSAGRSRSRCTRIRDGSQRLRSLGGATLPAGLRRWRLSSGGHQSRPDRRHSARVIAERGSDTHQHDEAPIVLKTPVS
jgi:hypothetical protein